MKRKFIAGLMATLALAVGTTSCSEDNKYEYSTSNECLITSMSMGSLKRSMHTLDSLGRDSIFYVTVTGAMYPMSIDQTRQRIYNLDSLPVGTDVSKMIFSSINTIGTFSIRSLQTGNDTIFRISDSTDFRVPRIITVHASDGVSKRDYQVSINVHQEEGDSMVWHQMGNNVSAFATLENTRSHIVDDQIYIFGQKDGKTHTLCTNAKDYEAGQNAQWLDTVLVTNILPQSILRFQNQFYAVNTDQQLYASADGIAWTALNTSFTASTLVVSGSKHIVALKDNHFYSSTDGLDWKQDKADDTQFLPETFATGTCIPSKIDKSFETLVIVGVHQGQNVVWKREIDLSDSDEYPWLYLPETISSQYNLPDYQNVTLSTYDQVTLLSGLTAEGQFAPLLLSRDNGRTWKKDDIKSPKAHAEEALAVSVDKDNFIWMFCGKTGEVWRGRINRLGWEEVPGAFEKAHHRSY